VRITLRLEAAKLSSRRVITPMILDAESWMNIRRFRALHDAGATYAEIAAEVGCDWRTVKKYLAPQAPSTPPKAPSRAGTQPQVITPFRDVVDAWLRAEPRLKGQSQSKVS